MQLKFRMASMGQRVRWFSHRVAARPLRGVCPATPGPQPVAAILSESRSRRRPQTPGVLLLDQSAWRCSGWRPVPWCTKAFGSDLRIRAFSSRAVGPTWPKATGLRRPSWVLVRLSYQCAGRPAKS